MPNAYDAASELASHINPAQAAKYCGFTYKKSNGGGEFFFELFSKPARLEFDGFKGYFVEDGREIPPHVLAIVLYHLAQADEAPLANNWIPMQTCQVVSLMSKPLRAIPLNYSRIILRMTWKK